MQSDMMNEREQGIGLLGCGAIGRGLARAVDEKAVGGARLVALFDQDSRNARDLSQHLESSPQGRRLLPGLPGC